MWEDNMWEDNMSEADCDEDGGYFANIDYENEQREGRRVKSMYNKIRKEENRKKQLREQHQCIQDLKFEIYKLNTVIDNLNKQLKDIKVKYEQTVDIINNPDALLKQQYDLINSLDLQLNEKDKVLAYYEDLLKLKPQSAKAMVELMKTYNARMKSMEDKIDSLADSQMKEFEKRCKEFYSSDEHQKEFAINELYDLKKQFNDPRNQEILSCNSDPYGEFDEDCVTVNKINEIIDNRVKWLKGNKK